MQCNVVLTNKVADCRSLAVSHNDVAAREKLEAPVDVVTELQVVVRPNFLLIHGTYCGCEEHL